MCCNHEEPAIRNQTKCGAALGETFPRIQPNPVGGERSRSFRGEFETGDPVFVACVDASATQRLQLDRGPGLGTALATVVEVLVEVPVMLSVCKVCNQSRSWYQRAAGA
jgi:hypothetical protein